MEKISVIIPTYNRFEFLLDTIKSIKEQTYENLEIIVVNDGSTQKEYYDYNWEKKNVKFINLEKNTKEIFDYASPGYVRNIGISHSTGDYIAFCDDDDIWFHKKLELQLEGMKKNNCKLSSTNSYIGNGKYNKKNKYKTSLDDFHFNIIKERYLKKNKYNFYFKNDKYPKIWDFNFLKIHNCIICSSVLIERKILNNINCFNNMKPPGEDYDCWLRALEITDCYFLNLPLVYYNNKHGNGRLWK